MAERATREAAWRWVQEHVDALVAGMRGDDAGRFVGFMTQACCDDGHRMEALARFEPRVPKIEGEQARLRGASETVRRCVAGHARRTQVDAFLSAYRPRDPGTVRGFAQESALPPTCQTR